jgi:Polysaccharide lyase family 8, C-terminal beta-sandwich domain
MCFDEIQAPKPEICDQAEQGTWCWRVLANTTAVQAVQLDDGVAGAAWYAAGVVDGVTMSGPAAAMWGRTRDGWTLGGFRSDPAPEHRPGDR